MVATPIRLNGASRSVLIRGTVLARSTFWLSGALALVTAAATAATFFIPGVLRGPAVMNGSARGTALVILLVGVPALLIAMWSAANGSIRALVVWLGVIAYLSYNAVMFLFATPFNQLFLLYVAMFSLCFWSATSILHQVDVDALRARFSPRLPVRGLAAYALAIVGLNALVWLRNVVPSVLSSTPASVARRHRAWHPPCLCSGPGVLAPPDGGRRRLALAPPPVGLCPGGIDPHHVGDRKRGRRRRPVDG